MNQKCFIATAFSSLFIFAAGVAPAKEAAWQPAQGPLMTRWAKDVTPDRVLPEYPRPQMVRESWTNLNGLWKYAIRPKDQGEPDSWDDEILVPFAIESALSGVMKPVGPENRLWYRRTFDIPRELENDGRLLLHFGAVDWHAVVYLNGRQVGEHKGGYDPFTIDITDSLAVYLPTDNVAPGEGQELVVSVWDPTDASFQPRGKQVAEPRGIWYTSVTGIWQTVWLEPVPASRIRDLRITTDIDRGQVDVRVESAGALRHVFVEAFDGEKRVAFGRGMIGEPVTLVIEDPRRWSPDDPFLYRLKVSLNEAIQEDSRDGAVQLSFFPMDAIESYFGMRKIEVKKADDGFNRLFLNNQPLFQFGPLDQGWWPDGLYTAPTDEALKFDIEMTKKMGFNMARKHVKVEPARWYYWCDKLGLMVWQDMPNGDRHIRPDQPDIDRSPESEATYRREWQATIDANRNHPSIVAWVPFNEGWGQFKTDEILAWTKQYDPTRLVDGPSGWSDRGSGDMNDMHSYPGPAMPEPEARRAVVLGEFGGLGLPVEGHLWWDKRNWGYRTYKTKDELRMNYKLLMRQLHPLIERGLAAAIYTQTTDVEGEVNGLLTYDRSEIKPGLDWLAAINNKLYGPPPVLTVTNVLPTSEKEAVQWKYTTDKPADDGWQQADFDDAQWNAGPGGFGDPTTPGSVVRTNWKTDDIWLRQEFSLDKLATDGLHLRLHHDEDVEVFVNGKRVASLTGFQTGYVNVDVGEQLAKQLRRGKNVIAVHCHQTGGGQYIDVGIVQEIEKPAN